ncbi:NAD-dependent epimerase/dehydratase family protein [Kroppenstedtia eburnea]|uniref:UDP-glucose 4-epimerase n=1 Tax=Kroppenstedtia eburnea TaxID=714067 RepID=A0A1N7IS09_9BACL|nr:NAD-dependent epimerase/dehydratase family protein [Kroppenstedtia eburnea]QKI82132.1 NAD-dependent epimerase/dehydratase family protein [Kroppenstedtia eburnea]SIS39786.1 UDP-glucose 4-epimerase [Kroppenstedtia eburnea]
MKILVTGGAGFIGSHLVDTYIRDGHEVVVVDHLGSGQRENLNDQAVFYETDILSEEFERVVEKERPDVINHHAAQKSVPDSVQNPRYDANINILGLLSILEESVKYGVKKVIYASTGALAGDRIPAREDHEPQLLSPYAISKYTGEKYLRFYFLHYGLKFVALRYANVYGTRQVADGECGVIPIFFNNYLAHRPSVLMADPDQPEGTTRDYVHVRDVAVANRLALEHGENEILYISSGTEIHIAEVYQLMKEVLGHDLPLIRKGPRAGDLKRCCLDNTRAKQVLGWKPRISLREGMEELRTHFMHV